MNEVVEVRRDGDVGVITLNNPPVNALSPAVLEGLAAAVTELVADPAIRALVLTGAGKAFCGGADIKEFGKITSGHKQGGAGLNPVLEKLEGSSKPIVCAINGICLGGGCETAMACHYRMAARTAQLGQPEVKLGLIPGAGGTQRLPRLVGLAKAAEMCAAGNPISAADAHAAGLVDRLATGDLQAEAIRFAREVAGSPPRRTRDRSDKLGDVQPVNAVREQFRKKSPHLLAPLKAIDAVEASAGLPFDEGLRQEGQIFKECLFSDQSKALIHVFFSEREVGKIPGLSRDTPTIPIRQAAVVGAGTMGGGIAMVYANAGLPVLLKEVNQEALDRGLERIRRTYADAVQRGRLTQADADQRLQRIRPTVSFDGFRDADIVVEAVFENLDLKKAVFAELDRVARKDAVLASNTSTLDIDALAAVTSRPQQVVGNHFFSPAPVMRLLEIVRGKQTSPAVLATSLALAKTLGKVGVLVGNAWGFVGNRLFGPYLHEAMFLVEEGASVEAVDAAFKQFGMAMGPLAVDDLAGIDVGWRVRQEHKKHAASHEREPKVADRLYELGRYGQKTGAGWYRYEGGGRTPIADPEVQRLIEETARQTGIKQRTVSSEEILERPLYALINEGAKVLAEGVALRASDIDIIYINGYGFPAHRGGPMWYADTVGLRKVYERVRHFEKEHGARWAPAKLLRELAESGRTFADYDKEPRTK